MTELLNIVFSVPGLAVAVALILAGAVQGSTGFGFNMLAAPLLAVIDPAFVPGPMLAMAILICIGGALRERSDINRQDLGYSLAGRVVSAGVAALCIGLLSPSAFSALFGGAVLLAVALSLIGWRVEPSPVSLFVAGTVSGFMGTLTSIGAAPMALVYQNAGAARMRSTLSAFFLFGGLVSIAALALAGRFGMRDLVLAGLMAPPAFLGFFLSGWGKQLVDRGQMKWIVLIVSALSGVILLWRAFT